MADSCCSDKGQEIERLATQAKQRRVLHIVLAINAGMFVVEFGGGLWAGSAALMADSADMLGDALVYGISLYALSRGPRWKARAALAKGAFILVLGIAVLIQIGSKILYGVPPVALPMLLFGMLALVANLVCLALLWPFQKQDINMSSTFECSRNDVISNVGVIAAAGLVWLLASPWPDIFIAGIVAIFFLRSAMSVLGEAVTALKSG